MIHCCEEMQCGGGSPVGGTVAWDGVACVKFINGGTNGHRGGVV